MPLTQPQLETHLWKAADILRGRIDSGDYKHYIFGLLFFKRLSDVWQEEYEDRLARYHGNKDLAADPEEHRFHIPPGQGWDAVRQKTTDIGAALNQAFHAIEDANTQLKGVFQDVDFNNKERFPDTVLEALLQHFDRHRLRRSDVEPDVLGSAYEYLIAQFADDAGKKGGEFYTPKMVVRLIVEMLRPDEGMEIYDPTCGSGGMLLEAVHHLERQGKNSRSLHLAGQEMNLNTWAICKMNLFLHDIDDAEIARGDTLRDPKLLTPSNTLRRFDRVLANPPFSLKSWGHKEWKDGPRSNWRSSEAPGSIGSLRRTLHAAALVGSIGLSACFNSGIDWSGRKLQRRNARQMPRARGGEAPSTRLTLPLESVASGPWAAVADRAIEDLEGLPQAPATPAIGFRLRLLNSPMAFRARTGGSRVGKPRLPLGPPGRVEVLRQDLQC